MGLKQQQDLLARLYTDEAMRRRFREHRVAVAGEFGLTEAEANDLSEIASAEIDWFANSLQSKRLREVKKLLPVTTRAIGEKLGPLFRKFSDGFNPISVKKHLEDTLGFADWLLRGSRVDAIAADIVRFESVRLRHNSLDRPLSMCHLTN